MLAAEDLAPASTVREMLKIPAGEGIVSVPTGEGEIPAYFGKRIAGEGLVSAPTGETIV